jgi:hypothetical protein
LVTIILLSFVLINRIKCRFLNTAWLSTDICVSIPPTCLTFVSVLGGYSTHSPLIAFKSALLKFPTTPPGLSAIFSRHPGPVMKTASERGKRKGPSDSLFCPRPYATREEKIKPNSPFLLFQSRILKLVYIILLFFMIVNTYFKIGKII